MKANKDWNYERYRTRDLLLEYDLSIMPLHPRTAGLSMIYPWEKTPLQFLGDWLYTLAAQSGYNGTKEDFLAHFGDGIIGGKQIIYDYYVNFPNPGELDKLYFDLETKILYYWDNTYIPVNAMLIVNTILNGGEA